MLKNIKLESFKDSLAKNIILHLDSNNLERDFSKKIYFFYFYSGKKYESSYLKDILILIFDLTEISNFPNSKISLKNKK